MIDWTLIIETVIIASTLIIIAALNRGKKPEK